MPKLVIDTPAAGPIWSLPSWAEAEIRAALPESWQLVVLRHGQPQAGGGSPADRVTPETLRAVRGAEVYIGMGVPREVFLAATAGGDVLRWAHTGSAGVASSLFPEMRTSNVTLTNSAGIMGVPMAETVLAMVLYFARGLDIAVAGLRRREWSKDALYDPRSGVRELGDATLGIVGLGGIGQEVARRARALGMRVRATRRTAAPALPDIEVRTGPEALDWLLESTDYVVLTLPGTPATRGLIGAPQLARMRSGAVLINVARGSIVDEPALIEALRSGRLRGAGLDVFAREPLPLDSPLWDLPNVLVLPHASAVTPLYWTRETELIVENLRRYLAGRPLLNVVDKDAGY